MPPRILDLFHHTFGNGQKVKKEFPFFIGRYPHPSYEAHRHTAYEFFYVVRGSATHLFNQKKETVREGDLVFVNLTTRHGFVVDDPGSFEIFNVIFLPEIFLVEQSVSGNAWKKKFLEPFYLPRHRLSLAVSERARVLWTLSEILAEFREKRRNHPRVIASLMSYLFEVIMRIYLTGEKKGGGDPKVSARFHPIQNHVAEHFTESLSLAGLADRFKLTVPYLSAAFKKNFGISFKNFLTLKRIEYAKFLLRTSEKPVTDIALECGFENLSTFERSFRKTTGSNAKQFRSG